MDNIGFSHLEIPMHTIKKKKKKIGAFAKKKKKNAMHFELGVK